jgi:LAO/AO transport system kinase
MSIDPEGLADRVLAGDRLTLARLLTLIENEEPEGLDALTILYPHTGNAHRIGITGAPGTGKSTLVNRLAGVFRKMVGDKDDQGLSEPDHVAVVAVDASSPFTGGAILGDRIRMRDLAGDPGIFIRSMASRGTLGGLAKSTSSVVEALDAAGFGIILIETVGAGQAEIEIARAAHTIVVIDAPGLGDDVQAIKAGILEIADILVVNKCDLPGADNTLSALQAALTLGYAETSSSPEGERGEEKSMKWRPPILPTIATQGDGIPQLANAIQDHRACIEATGEWIRRERESMKVRLEGLLREQLVLRFMEQHSDVLFESLLDKVLTREVEPRRAIQLLIKGEAL